tara:strand:- start:64 stop:372 length:309 start_codon:yes stop_codon:yes gene_type:complete
MARSKAENKAIHDKVERLIQEGFPVDQATAIAFRMFRDGELDDLIAAVPKLRAQEAKDLRELEELRIKGTRAIQLSQEEAEKRLHLLKKLRAKRNRKINYGR